MWSYVISSSWPSIGDWIVANLERLPLPTSRIHLKITLFITCQDPLTEEVDLCYRTQRASCFAKWRLYFFFVRTFWFNYHLWQQGFSPSESTSTSTVQEKWLYSRKVFLRILCVIRGVDCYILLIPSLWWFQLSRSCLLKCKRQTTLWSFFSADMSSPIRLIGNTPWNWS